MESKFREKLKAIHKKIFITYLGSLVLLLLLSVIANFILKEQVALQVTSLIRRMIHANDIREIVYTLGSARLNHFDAVVFKTDQNNRVFSIPAAVDPQVLREDTIVNSIINTYLPITIYSDEAEKEKSGTILFIFNRFSYCPIAFMIWILLSLIAIPSIISYRKKVYSAFEEQIQIQQELLRADLAKKVRHDIRSPLAALQALIFKADLNLKDKNNLNLTINRIQEIISDLEDKTPSKTKNTNFSTEELSQLINEVIGEKNSCLSEDFKLYLIADPDIKFFSKVLRAELKRTISNVIDNALQATSSKGEVRIFLTASEDSNQILISDTGKGIPEHILERIGEKGFSYNKDNGSGLGLYYANETMQDHGGSFTIKSKYGDGTIVLLQLPLVEKPSWFVDQLEFKKGQTVVLLDDQKTNFYVWETLLEKWLLAGDLHIKFFDRSEDFVTWVKSNPGSLTTYLVDYDLGKNTHTGLDIIKTLGIEDKSILVTGHFDNKIVQDRCLSIDCRLLPKGHVPIIEVS